MSVDPSTPIARNRSVSYLSSRKVRSAFKSPLRSPLSSSCSSPNSGPSPSGSKRSLPRKRSSLTQAFNSPLREKVPRKEAISQETVKKLRKEVEVQEEEIKQLQSEGLNEQDLEIHIQKLHEYNEIKDIGQLVIGRLAIQLQTTTRDLYSKFNLNLED